MPNRFPGNVAKSLEAPIPPVPSLVSLDTLARTEYRLRALRRGDARFSLKSGYSSKMLGLARESLSCIMEALGTY